MQEVRVRMATPCRQSKTMPKVQDGILGDGTNQDTESRDSGSVNNAEQEERTAQPVSEEAFPGKNKERQLPQRRV